MFLGFCLWLGLLPNESCLGQVITPPIPAGRTGTDTVPEGTVGSGLGLRSLLSEPCFSLVVGDTESALGRMGDASV